jgi:threonine/homoserine/homoserine lactone efflux protein
VLLTAALGWLLGFCGSVPAAGPIYFLILTRTTSGRARHGLEIALGAAIAEAMHATLAVLGFGIALSAIPALVFAGRLTASTLSCVLGITLLGSIPRQQATLLARRRGGWWLGFSITAINPMILLSWSACIATLGVEVPRALVLPFALGAAFGVLAWFGLLVVFARRLRPAQVLLARRVLAVALIGAGLAGTLLTLLA